MCNASKVTNDWVVKGAHVHIVLPHVTVELGMFPDHQGGVGFKPVFASTRPEDAAEAIRIVTRVCLPNPAVRRLWLRSVAQATRFVLSFDEEPAGLANGRMLEFLFLRLALERY